MGMEAKKRRQLVEKIPAPLQESYVLCAKPKNSPYVARQGGWARKEKEIGGETKERSSH